MLLDRLKDRTAGTPDSFPYERTTLYRLLKHLGFRYRVYNRRKVIMEAPRIVALRHRFLRQIAQVRAQGKNIVYLDETWFDTHTVPSRLWSDGSDQCIVDVPATRGKRLLILHAGGNAGFVDGCLMVSNKSLKDASVDYHDDMNSELFEKWFQGRLLPALPPDSVIVMDNAPYHSRILEKPPTQASLKSEIIDYMHKKSISVPNPPPVKSALLDMIKKSGKKMERVYATDHFAGLAGHKVVRLPPYLFNPIEMVWASLKSYVARHNSLFTSIDCLYRFKEACDRITAQDWEKYVTHCEDLEKKYYIVDQRMEEEFEPFIISLKEDSSSDDDEEQEKEHNSVGSARWLSAKQPFDACFWELPI